MKKPKTMRVAVLLLALTLITSCFVGSTFAKYVSTASGESKTTVAKWSIKVNETELAVENSEVKFDLFSTIKDSDGTSAEADVVSGKIAPGTSGSFDLVVENLSEVTADYTIKFAVENVNDIPLQFKIGNDGAWTYFTSFNSSSSTAQRLAIPNGTEPETSTTTVYWRWLFDANGAHQTDASDTALGIQAKDNPPTVTVTATITATQVD